MCRHMRAPITVVTPRSAIHHLNIPDTASLLKRHVSYEFYRVNPSGLGLAHAPESCKPATPFLNSQCTVLSCLYR